MHVRDALVRAAHQQLAVEHAGGAEGLGDVGKLCEMSSPVRL